MKDELASNLDLLNGLIKNSLQFIKVQYLPIIITSPVVIITTVFYHYLYISLAL